MDTPCTQEKGFFLVLRNFLTLGLVLMLVGCALPQALPVSRCPRVSFLAGSEKIWLRKEGETQALFTATLEKAARRCREADNIRVIEFGFARQRRSRTPSQAQAGVYTFVRGSHQTQDQRGCCPQEVHASVVSQQSASGLRQSALCASRRATRDRLPGVCGVFGRGRPGDRPRNWLPGVCERPGKGAKGESLT